MNKIYMVPIMLIIIAGLGVAPPAHADLVGLTLILIAIWTSGIIVNETIVNPGDKNAQAVTVKTDTQSSPVRPGRDG